jgi:hypothetical protein
MAGEVLSRALGGLQQAAEDYAKRQEEAQKAQAAAVGNRKLYDIAVQQGIFGPDEQIKYNKGNAQTKDSMIASAVRTFSVQQELEGQRVREETLGIQKAQEARAKAQYEYQPGGDVYNAAAQADQVVIPRGPGQGFELRPAVHETPVISPQQQAEARAAGKAWINGPNGPVLVDLPTPPTPKLFYPGSNIPISPESELGKERLRSINPQQALYDQYALTPDDILQPNPDAQFGSYDKKTGFDPNAADWTHAKIKGQLIPMPELIATQQKLIDAGQTGTKTVRLPDGRVIQPQAPQTAQVGVPAAAPGAGAGPAAPGQRRLDPTNPSDIALVHMLLNQNNNDLDAAQAQAKAMGLTWF